MDCLLAAVFAARSGLPPAHPFMVAPPPELDGIPRLYAEKGILGTSYPHHLETPNFTLQWSDPSVEEARAAQIGEVLEYAWTALVEEAGWTPPVSSDRYLLWVILDPSLPGSGYTAEYTADEFPEGYPVTWLSPTYLEDEYPGFALSVAAHEFGHMLHYAVAEWDPSDGQTWYWEATAEWQAERALRFAGDQGSAYGAIETYALSSYWYARGPELAFDATVNNHAYGMVLLNAFLDEHLVGIEGLRDIWNAAGPDWDAVIASETGLDFTTVMHEFVGAYATEDLAESALYDRPIFPLTYDTVPASESLRLPDLYGTVYIEVADYDPATPVAVRGPVDLVVVQDGAWDVTPSAGPVLFAVTATAEAGSSFDFGFELGPEDDTGVPDTGEAGGGKDGPRSCGCRSARRPDVFGFALGAALALRRRRSGAIVGPLRR